MSGDIQRLFSIIKQTDLPYRVFNDGAEDAAPPPPAPSASPAPERTFSPPSADAEPRGPATEATAPAPAHAGLFRVYNVEAALSPPAPGSRLADIFERMARSRGA